MYIPQINPRKSSYKSNIHQVYSPKKKRVISAESDLEYYNLLKNEFNPRIIDYCEQPLTVTGIYEGKKVSSRFDVWNLYTDLTEEFQEVKPSDKLNPSSSSFHKVQRQIAVQREWCKEHSKRYRIITEKDIFNNLILLNNLDKIHCFIRSIDYINSNDIEMVLSYLSKGPTTLRHLVKHLNKFSSHVYSVVFFLAYIGKCNIDIYTRPLSYDTEVILGCLNIN